MVNDLSVVDDSATDAVSDVLKTAVDVVVTFSGVKADAATEAVSDDALEVCILDSFDVGGIVDDFSDAADAAVEDGVSKDVFTTVSFVLVLSVVVVVSTAIEAVASPIIASDSTSDSFTFVATSSFFTVGVSFVLEEPVDVNVDKAASKAFAALPMIEDDFLFSFFSSASFSSSSRDLPPVVFLSFSSITSFLSADRSSDDCDLKRYF